MIAEFQIQTTLAGAERIVIDGVDISDRVSSFALVSRPGEVTRLTVELRACGPVEGLADVAFIAPAVDLAHFFAGIDADELERVALDSLGAFDDVGATQAMLNTLAAWAAGSG